MKKRLRSSDYPLDPRSFGKDDNQWFYETPQGLCVVAELRDKSGYHGTTNVTIPWQKVVAAVENHMAVEARRKAAA